MTRAILTKLTHPISRASKIRSQSVVVRGWRARIETKSLPDFPALLRSLEVEESHCSNTNITSDESKGTDRHEAMKQNSKERKRERKRESNACFLRRDREKSTQRTEKQRRGITTPKAIEINQRIRRTPSLHSIVHLELDEDLEPLPTPRPVSQQSTTTMH